MTYDAGGQAPASSLLLSKDAPHAGATDERLIEVAVPVYNEEKILARSVRRLHSYLTDNLPFPFIITIADNASTDGTHPIAQQLGAELAGVSAVHLDGKGRGLALRHVWGASEADIVAYMDVDMSTGLEAFLPLIAPLLSGDSDLATGSRLTPGAKVVGAASAVAAGPGRSPRSPRGWSRTAPRCPRPPMAARAAAARAAAGRRPQAGPVPRPARPRPSTTAVESGTTLVTMSSVTVSG